MPAVMDFILHSLNGPNSPIDFNSSFAWVIVMRAGHDWNGLIPIYRKCVWNRIEISREWGQVILVCVVKRVWVWWKVILVLKVKLPHWIPCLSFWFPSTIASAAFLQVFLLLFLQGSSRDLESEWWFCLQLCPAQIMILSWWKIVTQILKCTKQFPLIIRKIPQKPN